MSEPTTLQDVVKDAGIEQKIAVYFTKYKTKCVNKKPVTYLPGQYTSTFLIFLFVCRFGVAGIRPH